MTDLSATIARLRWRVSTTAYMSRQDCADVVTVLDALAVQSLQHSADRNAWREQQRAEAERDAAVAQRKRAEAERDALAAENARMREALAKRQAT